MQNLFSNSGLIGVVVTAGGSASNRLGVIRAFGRRGVPVIYIDSEHGSIVTYSKYITLRLRCQNLRESETEFVNGLLDFGRTIEGRMMVIPTGDRDVLALSKYKPELERFYHIPVPAFEIAQKLVDKKKFYRLLAEMRIPHPKTYFPESLSELRLMGREVAYPYIIKPADSLLFQDLFQRKNFVINSPQELEWAVDRLMRKNLKVVIQEIIPGNEIYMFYTYLNRKSEPLAVCGYDKIRQYPPRFWLWLVLQKQMAIFSRGTMHPATSSNRILRVCRARVEKRPKRRSIQTARNKCSYDTTKQTGSRMWHGYRIRSLFRSQRTTREKIIFFP